LTKCEHPIYRLDHILGKLRCCVCKKVFDYEDIIKSNGELLMDLEEKSLTNKVRGK